MSFPKHRVFNISLSLSVLFHLSKPETTILTLISSFPRKRSQSIRAFSTKAKYEFQTIIDNYKSIKAVQQALRDAGLESSNLIVGIDFTKSNTWTGEKSFNGRCLHDIKGPINPYQQVMGIMGRTLEAFDDDHLIPAFGFGNTLTKDKSCFPFFPNRPCVGLQELLARYKEIVAGCRTALARAIRAILKCRVRGRNRAERANQFRAHHRQSHRDSAGGEIIPHTRAYRRRAGLGSCNA